jgi:putative molybdopterin biosynthesis protein
MDRKTYKRKIYLEDKPRSEAKREILEAFSLHLEIERLPTSDALGRVTAEPIFANVSMPQWMELP